MPKRSSRPGPHDLAELAASIAADAPADKQPLPAAQVTPQKNPHAQALGRLGGLKGGKARAAKLSPERRSQIAREAVQARWQKKQRDG
jgi:hypothetical protein